MATTSERRKLIAIIAVAAAAVLIVAGGAAAVGWLAGRDVETVTSDGSTDGDAGDQDEGGDDDAAQDDDASQDDDGGRQSDDGVGEDDADAELVQPGGDVVPERMGGLEAIEELGENLEAVAKKNGMTADQLRDLLLQDSTAKISPSGFVLFVDTATPPPAE